MSSIAMEVCPQQKSIWFWFLIFWCDKSNGGNRHRLHRTHLYVVQPSRRNCACSPSRRRSRGPWDHWFIVPEHDDMDLYCVLVYNIHDDDDDDEGFEDYHYCFCIILFFIPMFAIFYYLLLSLSLIIGVFNISNFVDSGRIIYSLFCFLILYIMYSVWSIIYTFDWCCFHYYAF